MKEAEYCKIWGGHFVFTVTYIYGGFSEQISSDIIRILSEVYFKIKFDAFGYISIISEHLKDRIYF